MTFVFSPSTTSFPTPATTATDDKWSVSSTATILVPVDASRKRCSIYHESTADLLIDFGQSPTLTNFAFALPGHVVYVENDWSGQIRAISRDGSAIDVHVRTFY